RKRKQCDCHCYSQRRADKSSFEICHVHGPPSAVIYASPAEDPRQRARERPSPRVPSRGESSPPEARRWGPFAVPEQAFFHPYYIVFGFSVPPHRLVKSYNICRFNAVSSVKNAQKQ